MVKPCEAVDLVEVKVNPQGEVKPQHQKNPNVPETSTIPKI